MEKPYKLGINILGNTDQISTADQIKMIRGVGFDAFFTGWNPERTDVWANAAAREGMIYQSIHSPFTKVHKMWKEGEEGVAVTNQLIECARDCARHDIPVMVIHPFIGFKDHTPTQVGLDNYARVVEEANKLGIKLGFENVEGEEYLAAIMKAFWNEPCCGFCFDTGHELCYNGGKDMMALYGEKLCHTHFDDNLGVHEVPEPWHNDLHQVMGDGIVDWENVINRIEKVGYRDILMCELTLHNKPGMHTHDAYIAMPLEKFYAFAYDRALKVSTKTLKK